MNIKIMSEKSAVEFAKDDVSRDWVFISIKDEGKADIKNRKIARFNFQDQDDPNDTDPPTINHINDLVRLFKIIKSLNEENIVVHCHAGICRSSAVAIALFSFLNKKVDFNKTLEFFRDDLGWIMPNTLICQLLDDKMMWNGELISLCSYINEIGLKERLSNG